MHEEDNSGDIDDGITFEAGKGYQKKNAHTAAEQKRRDAIKKGLDQLQQIVPGCSNSDLQNGMISKTSKAQILQKAIDYMNYMVKDRDRKKQEIADMEKKLAALKIMKKNYEDLVKTNDAPVKAEISDELKFTVFKFVMASLFETFNVVVLVNNFQSLSGTVISWLEEHCKPEALKAVVVKVVRTVLG